jgi:Putative Ig domain
MLRFVTLVIFSVAMVACGGGGGGGGSPPVVAPSNLSYAGNPFVFTTDVAITPALTPTVTGTVTSYSISPAPPTGISFNATNGSIAGTPTQVTSLATYTVRASNSAGGVDVPINITVNPPRPTNLSYSDAPIVGTVGVRINPVLRPTVNGAVDSYSVDIPLPAGLLLNPLSGIISGTPKAAIGQALYTVHAINKGGDASFGVSITIGEAPSIATGVFRGSRVQNLDYSSNGVTPGVTNAKGEFQYAVGQPVVFKVGNVVLGTAPGIPLVTPVDLGATPSSIASDDVINIVRFLLMLDEDADSSNGIRISDNVRAKAITWGSQNLVNFAQSDTAFETSIASVIADAKTAGDSATHVLPDKPTAQDHLRRAFYCAYSGDFIGQYIGDTPGDDHGLFSAIITPDGAIETVGHSLATPPATNFDAFVPNAQVVNVAATHDFSVNDPTEPLPLVLSGKYLGPDGATISADDISGNWTSKDLTTMATQSGTYVATRLGGEADSKYRYTGNIEDIQENVLGMFVADRDGNDNVTGLVYQFADGQLRSVVGSIANSMFTGTVGGVDAATGTVGSDVQACSNPVITSYTGLCLDGNYTQGGKKINFVTDGCQLN